MYGFYFVHLLALKQQNEGIKFANSFPLVRSVVLYIFDNNDVFVRIILVQSFAGVMKSGNNNN